MQFMNNTVANVIFLYFKGTIGVAAIVRSKPIAKGRLPRKLILYAALKFLEQETALAAYLKKFASERPRRMYQLNPEWHDLATKAGSIVESKRVCFAGIPITVVNQIAVRVALLTYGDRNG